MLEQEDRENVIGRRRESFESGGFIAIKKKKTTRGKKAKTERKERRETH